MSGMNVPVLRDAISARVSARRMESLASASRRAARAASSSAGARVGALLDAVGRGALTREVVAVAPDAGGLDSTTSAARPARTNAEEAGQRGKRIRGAARDQGVVRSVGGEELLDRREDDQRLFPERIVPSSSTSRSCALVPRVATVSWARVSGSRSASP